MGEDGVFVDLGVLDLEFGEELNGKGGVNESKALFYSRWFGFFFFF